MSRAFTVTVNDTFSPGRSVSLVGFADSQSTLASVWS
jgi:hypothetical protein